ncbi:uncharacterized protein LOC128982949 [Macrosteles quadrilineatus]|uniref:uncharacterized protein LOC128982949 n=1 Tax=Macrosteles quadrilineatus TaxID=74068 RepID=UPI0023E24FA7|nr:uncharacterized protein LOC128982949 [Macrosteles quadrilineatus]
MTGDNSMTEEPPPSIFSLPIEVLQVIGEYLSPRDLLAVSATCRHLRSVVNVNLLWQKYTGDGSISRGLDNVVSVVKPKYKNPHTTSLENLCEQRFHFLKQSRLLNNIYNNKYIPHSIHFKGYLSDLDTAKPVNSRQITYGGKYLFSLSYCEVRIDVTEVITIFDLENDLKVLKTVDIAPPPESYYIIAWVQVCGDKLVLQRDEWVDAYHIKLPESFERVYSINISGHGTLEIAGTLVIDKFLFVENITKCVINVWDLSDGCQCSDLKPQIKYSNLKMIGYSHSEMLLLLLTDIHIQSGALCDPHLLVYNVKVQGYSTFNLVLEPELFKCDQIFHSIVNGFIDSNYVVLSTLTHNGSWRSTINVYDSKTSSQTATKSIQETQNIEYAKMIDGYFLLPSAESIDVLSLKDLKTVWKINIKGFLFLDVLCFSSLSAIIVVTSFDNVEFWNLHKRKKVLHLPEISVVTLDDTCTKIIIHDIKADKLAVHSYW